MLGHVAKPISFEMRKLPDGTTCPTQTTEWSPCSRECGWGIRERVTNNNDKCDMRKETVLCQLRPCHYEPTIAKMLNVSEPFLSLLHSNNHSVRPLQGSHVPEDDTPQGQGQVQLLGVPIDPRLQTALLWPVQKQGQVLYADQDRDH